MNPERVIEQLQRENETLRQQNTLLEEQLNAAMERIAELEQRQGGPPSFVKVNRKPKGERKGRKKRSSEHNHGRKLEIATQVKQHALEACWECGCRLRGKSIAWRRQVVDIPAPAPAEVTEHQVLKRWCPRCGQWRTPQVDLAGEVVGQGRIGIRVATVVAYLRSVLRLPLRLIQEYLQRLHQFFVSVGEIEALLRQVGQVLAPQAAALQVQARASPVVHGDETGWRQDGQHGYVWLLATEGQQAVRYYHYDRSRSGAVVQRLLGESFGGHLVTDFYSAYNSYAGQHQRCWVHLLRDLHHLKEEHASRPEVVAWAEAVGALYHSARACLQSENSQTPEQREACYESLVRQTRQLGLAYAQVKGHPCQALAKRLLRHEAELFQFVLVPGLPADNNLAERSLRPVVVQRKISGGSRSAGGTQTTMILASLFATWQARGLNTFQQCLSALS